MFLYSHVFTLSLAGELLTCFDCQSIGSHAKQCWLEIWVAFTRIDERPSTVKRSLVRYSGQKERALTSPKTSALAFISVLPWRINDGADTKLPDKTIGCISLVKTLRGCDKSFSKPFSG
jgi:hypothetical protein